LTRTKIVFQRHAQYHAEEKMTIVELNKKIHELISTGNREDRQLAGYMLLLTSEFHIPTLEEQQDEYNELDDSPPYPGGNFKEFKELLQEEKEEIESFQHCILWQLLKQELDIKDFEDLNDVVLETFYCNLKFEYDQGLQAWLAKYEHQTVVVDYC
jgi:hypothetical protein